MNSAVVATAAVADAMTRLGLVVRVCRGVYPVRGVGSIAGPAVPCRHYGSVDVLFETLLGAESGDVVVIDNEARRDEGCIGDLFVREAAHRGVAGVVVNGCHRDTAVLTQIATPVFSLGAWPAGPARVRARPDDALHMASMGSFRVMPGDWVVADADGVVIVDRDDRDEVLELAAEIAVNEARQVAELGRGVSLYEQFQFHDYLRRREASAKYGFREHIAQLGRAIET